MFHKIAVVLASLCVARCCGNCKTVVTSCGLTIPPLSGVIVPPSGMIHPLGCRRSETWELALTSIVVCSMRQVHDELLFEVDEAKLTQVTLLSKTKSYHFSVCSFVTCAVRPFLDDPHISRSVYIIIW
jgi:hypothetical protein